MSQLLALNQAELAAKNNIADPEPIAQDPEPAPEKHIDAEVTKALVISMRESKRKLTA